MSFGWCLCGMTTGLCRQVRQQIFYKKKIANQTTRRIRRSVDRMSEEKNVLREAEVAKVTELFNSQIKIISNAECQKKLKGVYKIDPTHICGSTGSHPSFFTSVRLPFCKSHTSQMLTPVRATQGVLYPLAKEEGKSR